MALYLPVTYFTPYVLHVLVLHLSQGKRLSQGGTSFTGNARVSFLGRSVPAISWLAVRVFKWAIEEVESS